MKRALILGASGGIGSAVANNLKKQYWDVTSLSRSLNQFDITNEDSVQASLSSVRGPFNYILIATGALEIKRHDQKNTINHLLNKDNMIDHLLQTLSAQL